MRIPMPFSPLSSVLRRYDIERSDDAIVGPGREAPPHRRLAAGAVDRDGQRLFTGRLHGPRLVPRDDAGLRAIDVVDVGDVDVLVRGAAVGGVEQEIPRAE